MQRHGVCGVKIFAGYTLSIEMPNFISLCTTPLCFAQRLKLPVLSCQRRVQTRSLNFVYPSLVPALGLPQIPGSSRPLTYHREPAFRISSGLVSGEPFAAEYSLLFGREETTMIKASGLSFGYKWLLNGFPLRYILT